MLKFLSRRKRSRNAILIVFIFAMAITLVAFFTAGRGGTAAGASDNGSSIAKVDGLPVAVGEFKRRIAYLFPNDPTLTNPETQASIRLRGLDRTVRDVLVKEKVVELESQRLNLEATDEEVADRIAQTFSDNGKFIGIQEYKNRLAGRGVAWQEYERDLRNNISREKLNNFITSGVTVSGQEVEDEYKKTETSVNLTYGVIKPSDVRDGIKLSDDELRAYFDAHKSEFKIGGDQKKIDYLFVSTNELSKSVQVDDAELQKRYNTTDQIDQAHVRQIVLNVLTDKDDATVQGQATALIARAKGTNGAPDQDFATLAKGNSQDTATASKGGDLGFIKRDRNRQNDVLQRVFTMQDGQISDSPVKQGNKYYILKLEEKKKRTFDEAKEGLLVSARNDFSYKKAVSVADEARTMLLQNHDINKTAEEMNKKYGAGVVTVKTTPYFAPGDTVPDIGSNQQFEDSVKDLAKNGDIGPKTGVPNGFAVPMLADKRGPHDASFDEVKTKVEQQARNEKSKDVARQKADEIAKSATTPDALKTAIEALKLKAETKDEFKSGQTLTGVGQSGKIESAALALKEGQVDRQAIKVGDDYVILAATKKKDADMTAFNGDKKKTIEDRLLQERKSAIFDAYIDKRYHDLEKSGKIKLYDSVLDGVLGGPEQ